MCQSFLQPTLDLLQIPPHYLNISNYVAGSTEAGPGNRAVISMQGCLRHCVDCVNPDARSFSINQLISIDSLAKKILSNPHHTGVTICGGEPFWQAPTLTQLAHQLRSAGLNIIVITGFRLEQLHRTYRPAGAVEFLKEIDLLIDAHPVQSDPTEQHIHLLNPNVLGFETINQVNWDQVSLLTMFQHGLADKHNAPVPTM